MLLVLGKSFSTTPEYYAGTGGGGGGVVYQLANPSEFVENGGTGSAWCGGYGGGARYVMWYGHAPRVSTGGGTVVCYGAKVSGSGTVSASGTSGAAHSNLTSLGDGRWAAQAMSGGSGGGCVVVLNASEEANIKASANGGGIPAGNILVASKGYSGRGGTGSVRINWKTE